jgi:hypothetical protein
MVTVAVMPRTRSIIRDRNDLATDAPARFQCQSARITSAIGACGPCSAKSRATFSRPCHSQRPLRIQHIDAGGDIAQRDLVAGHCASVVEIDAGAPEQWIRHVA